MQTTTLHSTLEKQGTTAKTNSTTWENIEFDRNGYIIVVMGLIGCIGGFAAACGVQMGIVQLAAVVLPALFTLTMILAVAPMKWVFGAMSVALFVDVLIFILHYFA